LVAQERLIRVTTSGQVAVAVAESLAAAVAEATVLLGEF
jgi:hypothetical protein